MRHFFYCYRHHFVLLPILFCWSFSIHAGFYFHYGVNPDSFSDTAGKFTFNSLNNTLFIGAFVGANKRIVFGQNVISFSKAHQATVGGTEDQSILTLLEMGPRFILYMGESLEYFLSAAYHPYVKGTRKAGTDAESEIVSGAGYLVSFGYHIKVSKLFHLGASFNYHGVNLSEATVGGESSAVTYAYSGYYPMLEFSLRF